MNAPKLLFFGTKNGFSESHTNSFFFIDKENLILIDLSLSNIEKAKSVISENSKIKNVTVFLTHLHSDHASGIVMFGYFLHFMHPNIKYTVVSEESFAKDAINHFYTEGGNFPDLFEFIEISADKKILHPKLSNFCKKVIRTTHDPWLSGCCGYVFSLDYSTIVYSGDTNNLDHFSGEMWKLSKKNPYRSLNFELYIEMAFRKSPHHLCFDNSKSILLRLLSFNKNLHIYLMHYDDENALRESLLNTMCSHPDHSIKNRITLVEEF